MCCDIWHTIERWWQVDCDLRLEGSSNSIIKKNPTVPGWRYCRRKWLDIWNKVRCIQAILKEKAHPIEVWAWWKSTFGEENRWFMVLVNSFPQSRRTKKSDNGTLENVWKQERRTSQRARVITTQSNCLARNAKKVLNQKGQGWAQTPNDRLPWSQNTSWLYHGVDSLLIENPHQL